MKDLINNTYGYWTVLSESSRSKSNKRMWKCLCKCGLTQDVNQSNLISGKSSKCRECSRELIRNSVKLADHRLYSTWKSMKNRCLNPNNATYSNYGGRGISVCDRWLSFNSFVEDMFPSFEEGLTLDRIDVNGNYEVGNCRWANTETQSNNKVNSLKLHFDGSFYTEAQLARKFGISRSTIQARRLKGWSVEEMIYGKDYFNRFKNIEVNGVVYNSLSSVAKDFGINPGTFRYRIRNGWSINEAIGGKT